MKPLGLDAVVLAGGLGTRLRSVVSDVPKPMAPVAGRPFLAWLLDRLARAGVARVVLSTGYLGHVIRDTIGERHAGMEIDYVQEESPLGTGGATYAALGACTTERAIVLNGDTWLEADLRAMATLAPEADLVLAVRRVPDRSRYGSILTRNGRVTGVAEKGGSGPGLINGGIYVMRRDMPQVRPQPERFSLETALLAEPGELDVRSYTAEGEFLDIGTPEDFAAAQDLIPLWATR
ncbi:nucleotidyltransferase family protein [Roseomonas sp. NAR14]|uniref:Nucleotidyltransferase family protein n=1 Tax=Roseomonas acroporae TaxID=2937791 RepID=A0A9X1Y6F7_9PROT|nr:nucleotidyltransferase family protein [Roseomonas acroporae]MCK8784398.1 nucleotidyltransferase family protein [Roseomonas acroporae]